MELVIVSVASLAIGILVGRWLTMRSNLPQWCHDSSHTFTDLYDHRNMLFLNLCKMYPYGDVWKTRHHETGKPEMPEGFFLVGVETPDGRLSYHMKVEDHWEYTWWIQEIDESPAWDGVKGGTISRLKKVVK